jgi:hypothetical protein
VCSHSGGGGGADERALTVGGAFTQITMLAPKFKLQHAA